MLKKIAFTLTVIWPLALPGLEKKTVHFLCALFVGKSLPTQLWPQPSQSDTSLLIKATCQIKPWIIFKDSWIHSRMKKIFEKNVIISDKAQEASCLVVELVAKKMKSHTIAESLIMPACKIIVRTMVCEEAESELSKVPVSDNTVSRCVDDLSNNIPGVLSEILQNNNFTFQVDESTDVTGKAQLQAFVQFKNEGEIMENYFCCKELPETTKGHDVFSILSSYLESYGLPWNRCFGICIDGAPSVIGSVQGFVSRMKEKNPEVITTHCFLHREVLVSKTIGHDLQQVLDINVNVVNFIKQCCPKSRLFARLCENMQKDLVACLLHTEAQ